MHCGSGCRLGLCSSGYRIYGAVGIPIWRDPLPRHCHGHSGKLQHMQSAAQEQRSTWWAASLVHRELRGPFQGMRYSTPWVYHELHLASIERRRVCCRSGG